jgi:hypothetical protein
LSTTTAGSTFTLSLPSRSLIFSAKNYHTPLQSGEWTSAVFPDGWYGLINPGLAVWGSIPNKGELRNLPTKSRALMDIAFGELPSLDVGVGADDRSM